MSLRMDTSRQQLRNDADRIISSSIEAVLPDSAVRRAIEEFDRQGLLCGNGSPDVTSARTGQPRLILCAVGKAAWQMADAAAGILGDRITSGYVITKYGHVRGPLPGIECMEAGHPVPDDNTFTATDKLLEATSRLTVNDRVLFLLSGGGSALFEKPLIPGEELQDITSQLLSSGADINEINTVRKRLSSVKGGRFALHCAPAHVCTVVLSDIIGDPLDMIASGPAYPDTTFCADAAAVADKYGLLLSDKAGELIRTNETPKSLDNVTTVITGSVRELCRAAAREADALGYEVVMLSDSLCCEAREAGRYMASVLSAHRDDPRRLAFIAGGETVVHVKGHGLGGRNQELVLSAAPGISGSRCAVFSVGSDGTDGPTDAAGAYADSYTSDELKACGIDISDVLDDNDAYHALQHIPGALIFTGPTGTNVNDLTVALHLPG